ncbi:hypothetical protein SmJEL517_g02281 [Synchytrium microbalum]|uniref:SnoaL-like domain-containing protein n=1 Tax=Synchytrium microbalum TaxID=1806994 RepID=A0A507CCN7_9FUNG|nr:uncharacterized protein SmJEL517_g02281 [Synchytrium microbalum]TPX35325.1 hypothetical protein SmJEL517_g02281 [Synchytrium microbalum]
MAQEPSSNAVPLSMAFKHPEEYYADNAVICYLPTGAGASGIDAIKDFYASYNSQTRNLMSEEVISSFSSPDGRTVMLESILTCIHESAMDWVLPNVKVTGKRIQIPTVTIAVFDEEGKIEQQRTYWDQASVLKQITVLPQSLHCKANGAETTLPVLNGRIADLVRGFGNMNTLGADRQVAAGMTSAQANADHVVAQNARGKKNVAHGILPEGEDDLTAPLRTRSRLASANPTQPFAQDDDEPEQVNNSVERRHPNSIVPQGDVPVSTHRPTAATGQGVAGVFGGGNDDSTSRPSTRVHQAPGGETHFNIFSGNNTREPVRSSVAVDPTRNKGSVDLFKTASNPPPRQSANGRRDPNWSSIGSMDSDISAAGSVTGTPAHTGRRLVPGSNKSHFEFGSDNTEVPIHHGRKFFADSNSSSISFGSDLDHVEDQRSKRPSSVRDPNARSTENTTHQRPSSRVLNAPGGKSNFQFG